VVMAVLLLGQSAYAIKSAVTVRAAIDRQPLVQGGEGRIVVEITVDPAYHIQSAKPLDKYLIPTRVTVNAPDGVRVDDVKYPVAKEIPASPAVTSAGKL